MVFLPECFDFIARTTSESISMGLKEDDDYIQQFREMTKNYGIWLALGGFHNKTSATGDRDAKINKDGVLPYNTYLVIDDCGKTRAVYNKLHLFNLDIPEKVRLMENETYCQGNELVPPVDTAIGRLGLSICYDVRFPELSLYNRYKGAEILSFPSSFTLNTGLAHWETLMRARAIETQCYVIAAAQTGKHYDKRISYGHSMVVDPWGAVIAQCSDRVDICFAEIDLDYVHEIRTYQPVIPHRRSDLYSLIFNEQIPNNETLLFGSNPITKEIIFYRSGYSFAFVNLKPVLPGHVLCSPIRQALKLTDLTDQETADLFIIAKKVQSAIEKFYRVSSSMVCIQDGVDSGQTVQHVHIHIVPRKSTDFDGERDQFYKALQESEKSKPRSASDMAAEAAHYRDLLEIQNDLHNESHSNVK